MTRETTSSVSEAPSHESDEQVGFYTVTLTAVCELVISDVRQCWLVKRFVKKNYKQIPNKHIILQTAFHFYFSAVDKY